MGDFIMKKAVTKITHSTGIKDVYSVKDFLIEVLEYYRTGERRA